MVKSKAMLFAAVCLGVASLSGCGGSTAAAAGNPPGAPPPPGPAITVSVTAAPPSLGQGQSSTLTAAVTNDSKNAGVSWSLGSGDAGTLTTVDALHATYSPGNFTQAGSASITATSVTDNTKNAAVTIPYSSTITVTLSANPGSLGPNQSANITATVTNDAQNAGVTWSLSSGAAGVLTRVDALHASYAPGAVTQSGTATITAASVTDNTKSASVSIPYSPLPIAVAAAASPTSLAANQTSTLTATVSNDPNNSGVTWSLATSAAGTLTTVDALHATYAPGAVTVNGTAAITATSNTDSTKRAVVTVAYGATAPTVEIGTPGTSSVGPLQTSLITAATLDPSGVTWAASAGTITPLNSCSGGECTAIYTAPADIASSGTATITAASVTNPSATATATINLTAATYWEDLVAFENGFHLGVPKPYRDLERGTGIYQPDRMIFHEIALGSNGQPINTEVWRLDNDGASPTPDGSGAAAPSFLISGVLNRTPWNANGTYFNLQANPCVIEVFCSDRTTGQGGDLHNYLYDAAGDLQQLIIPTVDPSLGLTSPLALVSGGYLPWDKLNPNLFYVTNGAAGAANALYSVDISNQFTVKKIVDLPLTNPGCATASNPCPSSIAKGIQSYLSEDDVVMVDDPNPPAVTAPTPPAYIPYIYMVDVNPNRPATQNTIVYQFPINFSASLPGGLPTCPVASIPIVLNPEPTKIQCPTHSASEEYHFHDIFFQRDAADHFIFNYGPKGSGGEGQFWVAPENGQASLVAPFYPFDFATAAMPYMSHPAMNPDGTLVAYSGYDSLADQGGCCGLGNWVWSFSANLGLGGVVGNMGSQGAGHQGWDGYDPNYVVFDAYTGTPDANGNQLWSQMSDSPSDPDGTHARVLVDVPRNNSTGISLLDGPSQSPDGTKMMFVLPETFQVISNQTTQFSAYVAVDHRPFPPALAVTATSAGGVALSWTPYPYHREVAGYHVYRETGCSGAWSEVTSANNTAAAAFGSINATSFTDTSAQASTTYCYAVTAQEFSGLESSQLSNIMQVPVGGSATQTAAAGTTGWDTTAPAPPSGLAVTQLGPGEWKLTWQTSPAPNLRYYNIYYSGGGVPNVTDPLTAQHYLIDSPAATETSYIYWEANPNDVPVFGIVAVDRQDQVSTLACIATANPTAACSGQ